MNIRATEHYRCDRWCVGGVLSVPRPDIDKRSASPSYGGLSGGGPAASVTAVWGCFSGAVSDVMPKNKCQL
ncbi:hypothetical protein KEM60_03213 [Austwickia sp. TVS 96-490-7B]|nr:hypothetical protein [Austwickia sp. TVS 96-490-7B]